MTDDAPLLSAHPADDVHRAIVQALIPTLSAPPAEEMTRQPGTVLFSIRGPRGRDIAAALGGLDRPLVVLNDLHLTCRSSSLPSPDQAGIVDVDILRRVLDHYALALAAAGWGQVLASPVQLDAAQHFPPIRGLVCTMEFAALRRNAPPVTALRVIVDPEDV